MSKRMIRPGTMRGLRPWMVKQQPWIISPGGGVPGYSLVFDGAVTVDCGNNSSLRVNDGNMTVDLYAKWPSSGALAAWQYYYTLTQGDAAANHGYYLQFRALATPSDGTYYFSAKDAAAQKTVNTGALTFGYDTWYYIRARFDGTNIRISKDAGSENTTAFTAPGIESTDIFWIGRTRLGGGNNFKGSMCYLHVWNTDMGALASVPSSPFAVDANTVGRWTFFEGSGSSLADDSGQGNHGAINTPTWSADVPPTWSL